MSVFELKKVLIPPANPKEVGSAEDWNLFEDKLSVGLPEDYKEIIMTYGTGKICDFIVLYNPFSKIENINLIKEALNDSEGYLQLKNNHPNYYKHRRFPEEGGMIPFAGTDNGDIIYWLPNGPPENWSIIVYESRGPDHEEFNLNTSDFIYNIITKKLNTRIFPQDFPHDPIEFITI